MKGRGYCHRTTGMALDTESVAMKPQTDSVVTTDTDRWCEWSGHCACVKVTNTLCGDATCGSWCKCDVMRLSPCDSYGTNLALNLTSPTASSSTTRCTQVAGFLKAGPNTLKILANHLTMTMMNPFPPN